ncbi:MAG: thiol:disulfide interchange protein, partial [Gammaproteobacteria bacterium]|nr:thiol:disulfide interchange protein [Gammaproteobacteria bacterium]
LLWRGLQLDPHKIPSTLINKPVPKFNLPDLMNSGNRLTERQFLGQVSLVNVWATWCTACQQEHPILLDIARTHKVKLYAIDYKDDLQTAKNWLAQYGNPFLAIGFDATGQAAIDWGVYGTPETFLIDRQGIIRYKHIGPLTKQIWQNTLLPLIDKLRTGAV